MPENDKIQSQDPEAPPMDYAFWEVPGTTFKVIYSLPLFHEIDFVVNEGYRKIPHGGIEVGGLLFGSIDQEAVRVEAFRPINCEHASGPSLNFSERDLTELEKQIAGASSDRELGKLQPVGWFLAHTRGPLELTEAEAKQFDRFFPQSFKVTVLVKPERFQPTRFGFLVRAADSQLPREATATAVILPLPGRSHKAGQLIPSLPAPKPTNSAKRATHTQNEAKGQESGDDEKPVAPFHQKRAEPSKPAEPLSIWKIPPDADITEAETEESIEGAEPESFEPPAGLRTPAERAARRQLSRDRARIIEQAYPPPAPPPASPPVPFRPPPLPSLPANVARAAPSAYDRYGNGPGYGHIQDERDPPPNDLAESVLNPRSITALALAALLGCLAGYIAYLQLPAPVIPINVRPVNQTMVVSWPPDETRNAIYAAIRLNDGPPVPLSADEKRIGQVTLTDAKDFKVEVITRNWIRDSRGIVRYLHSANGNGQLLPSDTTAIP